MYGEKIFSDMDADEKIADINRRLETQSRKTEEELQRAHDEVGYWRDLFRRYFLDNSCDVPEGEMSISDFDARGSRGSRL